MNTEPLRKILDLEKQGGFTDAAVFGGLDWFLKNWSAGAVASVASPRRLARFRKLFDAGYAAMTPERRRAWAGDVLGFLNELESRSGVPAAATPAPPPKKSSPRVKKVASPADGKALEAPVTALKGISTSLSSKFGKLGVKTVRDLLYFFPH